MDDLVLPPTPEGLRFRLVKRVNYYDVYLVDSQDRLLFNAATKSDPRPSHIVAVAEKILHRHERAEREQRLVEEIRDRLDGTYPGTGQVAAKMPARALPPPPDGTHWKIVTETPREANLRLLGGLWGETLAEDTFATNATPEDLTHLASKLIKSGTRALAKTTFARATCKDPAGAGLPPLPEPLEWSVRDVNRWAVVNVSHNGEQVDVPGFRISNKTPRLLVNIAGRRLLARARKRANTQDFSGTYRPDGHKDTP